MIPPKQESEESPFLIFKIIHYKKNYSRSERKEEHSENGIHSLVSPNAITE